MNLGQQGVALFFAISGFLITTLLIKEDQHGGISLSGFYTRRAFRILPAAYIYLAVIVICSWLGFIRVAQGEIASAAFFYNNYWPTRIWFTPHFWSLSMEEHFYFLWPFAVALAGSARVAWVAVAGIVVTLIWRPWSLAHIHLDVPVLQRTDMRLDAFLWACLVAVVVAKRSRIFRIIADWRFHICMVVALIAVYAVGVFYPMQLTKLALQSMLMPLVIVPTVFLPNYWISRILEYAPLRLLGQISYGVYLWQAVFFDDTIRSYGAAAASFPIRVLLLLLLTGASYRWIERPLSNYGRHLGKAKS